MGSIGTWIVLLLLVAVIALVIRKLWKEKKQGKSACGNSCGCCPNASLCHTRIDTTKK